MLCYINPDIPVTLVNERSSVTPAFLLKFASGTLKDTLYQIGGKLIEWKLHDRITLSNTFYLFVLWEQIITVCI